MEKTELPKLLGREDLRAIAALAAWFGIEAHLVGGALRDLLLGKGASDFDFALSGAWEELPAAFALHIGGSFFWLDAERHQSRVVKKGKNTTVYDFAPLCGATIEEDLARRDFTVNALAVSLSVERRNLIDTLHGRHDLQNGIIRACGDTSFDDDPLRLLRAVRFMAELGFAIEENTWETMRRKAGLLERVAAERVRDELFKTLAAPGCGASLRKLDAAGLWQEIAAFPESLLDEADIARAEAAERLCMDMGSRIRGEGERLAHFLGHEVESGITVLSLIKLAAVLGCGKKGRASALAERLRLGREAERILELLCRDEGSVWGNLEHIESERVMYRFFRDREPAGPGMLVIAGSAGAVSHGCFNRMMHYYIHEYDVNDPDLFLAGGDIMNILAIPPGKAVGEAMARLREAESSGVVKSREEAREFVKNLLTNKEPMG